MKKAIAAIVLGLACIAGPASAHLVGGDGFFSGDLRPSAMHAVKLDLQGKEKTSIIVHGNGKGDIDCYLYEGTFPDHATFVNRDDSSKDGCELTVTPPKRGTYTLLVQNTSSNIEHYTGFVD